MATTELTELTEQQERYINSLERQNKELIVKNMDLQEQLHQLEVSKRLLSDYLTNEIEECNKEMKRLKVGSGEWNWFGGIKSTAERILIKFICL